MQRIERTSPQVSALQNDAMSDGERKSAGPSGLPSLGGPGELLKNRHSPAAQEDLPAAASRAPVPAPLPPDGFNLSLRVKLHPPSGNPRLHPVVSDDSQTRGRGAAHLGRQDPQTGVFVGTGQWNRADIPATGAPNRTEPLRDHEYQQAAYQLAARASADPIEDPSDLAHLAAATETVHSTRVDLKHGRGNFKSDIEASKGASTVRTMVAFDLNDAHGANTGAGVALAYGAANCDMNAWINTRRYSAKLMEPGETVSTVGNDLIPHTWSELNRPDKTLADGSAEPRSTIVLDSWADGPAVRLENSAHAPYAQTTTVDETFDRESGRPHLEVMNRARLKASPGGSLHNEAEASLQRRTKRGGSFRQVFTEFPVIHPDFTREAREALNAQSALTKELMAVAAGRNAYGLTVQEATHPDTSGAIATRAMQLDKPTRPPIIVPEDKPT